MMSFFSFKASEIFSGKSLKALIIRALRRGFFPAAFAKDKVRSIKAVS